jgi:hypothetical protein
MQMAGTPFREDCTLHTSSYKSHAIAMDHTGIGTTLVSYTTWRLTADAAGQHHPSAANRLKDW